MAKPKVKSVTLARLSNTASFTVSWSKSGTVTGYTYILYGYNPTRNNKGKAIGWKVASTGSFNKSQESATLSGPSSGFTSIMIEITPQYTVKKGRKEVTKNGTTGKSNKNGIPNPALQKEQEDAAARQAQQQGTSQSAAVAQAQADDSAKRAAPPNPGTPSVAFASGSTSNVVISGFGISTSVDAKLYVYESVDGKAETKLGEYSKTTSTVQRNGLPVGSYAKYRAQAYNTYSRVWSNSSAWSSIIYAPPKDITKLTVEANGANKAILTWTNNTSYTDAIEVQWSPRSDFLANATGSGSTSLGYVSSCEVTVDTSVSNFWYFRVRPKKGSLTGGWTTSDKLGIGSTPTAPTTYATLGSFNVEEDVTLRWTHNCEDDCTSAHSMLWLRVKHSDSTWATATETELGSNVLSKTLDLSSYSDGDEIHWKVKTANVLGTYGPYSTERVFSVYSKPELGISATSGDGESALGSAGLTSLPLTIGMSVTNTNHLAVMFSAWITNDYENTAPGPDGVMTTDAPGTTLWRGDVVEGDDGWSEGTSATIEVGIGNRIVSGGSYTIHATVAMSNGLRAEDEVTVEAEWDDSVPEPYMRFDTDDGYSAIIYPVCEAVDENGDTIPLLDEEDNPLYFNGDEEDPLHQLETGVTLAVYRVDAYGQTTLVQGGLANDGTVAVNDPYPTLNGCMYRLVATRTSTGATNYEDDTHDIDCDSVIIQWDEPSERGEDTAGFSMLELPYNLSMTNEADYDVSFAEYYGNDHPVARFGTQLGMKGSWSSDIVYARDSDELRLARRLQVLQDTCYVREPSGIGYRAVVKVTEKLAGAGLVALSFKVTRVME